MYARTRFSTIAALIVAVSSVGSFAADAPVLLSWKFKKGEQRHYVSEQKTSTEGEFGGQAIKNEIKQTLDMRWDIDSVASDGTAQMTQTVTRVRMSISRPGAAPIEYDSSSKEAPAAAAQLAAVFKPLVGKPIKLKMSPRGTISDVTLPEGMAEELKKTPGPAASMLNEESFKQMTGASTLEFADHPVKKGDTWKRTASTPNPATGGKQLIDVSYTFRGTEKENGRQVDKIDMTMKTSFAPGGAGAPQIEISDQQSEGKIDFDHTAGHIIQSRAKVKMVMAITVMGTKVDQTATSEAVMRLADGADDKQASESAK